MKSRSLFFALVIFCFFSCSDKKLDANYFTMDMPSGWTYEPGNGTDSFIGTLNTPSGTIAFDYSANGFAGGVILTEQQFIADEKNWAQSSCYFCKPDVTYVPAQDVEQESKRLMLQAGGKDKVPIKVEANIEYTKSVHRPDNKWKRYYPGADYIAELKYKDSTIYVPIQIPKEIKDQNIKIDTTAQYIIKTTWPKAPGVGTTGIYIKSRSSKLNFNMQGHGLEQDEQEQALKAFKTIKLKE